MNILTPGSKWRHYKSTGGEDYTYEVLGLVFHSETQEEMVLYKMLYDSDSDGERIGHPRGTLFVRPLSLWFNMVEHGGQKIQRFTEITEIE